MGTIAITGAASGLGAATTTRLRADGHRVITVDPSSPEATLAKTSLESLKK